MQLRYLIQERVLCLQLAKLVQGKDRRRCLYVQTYISTLY